MYLKRRWKKLAANTDIQKSILACTILCYNYLAAISMCIVKKKLALREEREKKKMQKGTEFGDYMQKKQE